MERTLSIRKFRLGILVFLSKKSRFLENISYREDKLRRNPIEDGAISGFSGQKSVPE